MIVVPAADLFVNVLNERLIDDLLLNVEDHVATGRIAIGIEIDFLVGDAQKFRIFYMFEQLGSVQLLHLVAQTLDSVAVL